MLSNTKRKHNKMGIEERIVGNLLNNNVMITDW